MPAFKWDEKKSKKYRYLIYGIPGIGKTTLATFMKGKTYLLSLDDSFHRIDALKKVDIWNLDPTHPIDDITEFIATFDPSKYDNLIIDNISNLQKLFFVEKAKDTKTTLDNKISDYGEWSNFLMRFISKVFSYDLNILVTAWEKQDKIVAPNGQEFMQFGPDIRSNPRDYIMGNSDQVGRMIQNPKTKERGIILEGSIDTYAKNRLDDRMASKASEFFKVS